MKSKNLLKNCYIYVRKYIRFYRLLKHTLFYVIGFKSSEYLSPPAELPVIGHFDRKMLIQVDKKYQKYFSDENLSLDSDKRPSYKKNKVVLIVDNGEVLVRKNFTGFRRYNDFYSELLCYEKIAHLDLTPEIVYVDFKKCQIYMKYIDGINLSTRRLGIHEIVKLNEELIQGWFKKIVRNLHDNGIIFNDLSGRNVILKNDKLYIFDFSDAIYFDDKLLKLYPVKRFFLKLVSEERKKMKEELEILGLQ